MALVLRDQLPHALVGARAALLVSLTAPLRLPCEGGTSRAPPRRRASFDPRVADLKLGLASVALIGGLPSHPLPTDLVRPKGPRDKALHGEGGEGVGQGEVSVDDSEL